MDILSTNNVLDKIIQNTYNLYSSFRSDQITINFGDNQFQKLNLTLGKLKFYQKILNIIPSPTKQFRR